MTGTNKYYNGSAALLSYCAARLLRKPLVYGMPPAAGIELTNMCNLKCPECSSGSGSMKRSRGYMKEELYKKIISEAGEYLYNINLYFQGEPMMHPGFFRFVKIAWKTSITVSTNGHFLNKENCRELAVSGIKKLIVSIDGMDNETYSRYRVNGDFEKVISGIRNLSGEIEKNRSPLKLEIQFLVNNFNESQISEAETFASEVNCSLKLKSMQVINPDNTESWMPEKKRFRRYYKNDKGEFVQKKTPGNSCIRVWMNPVITWDGKVVPCCFDKDAEHIMGDLNEASLREIWHGDKFREFRESVLTEKYKIEMCRSCTTGLRGVAV